MNLKTLPILAVTPELRLQALRGFQGAYSLDAAHSDSGTPVLVLQVAAGVGRSFPTCVEIDGAQVPIEVRRGFMAPSSSGRKSPAR